MACYIHLLGQPKEHPVNVDKQLVVSSSTGCEHALCVLKYSLDRSQAALGPCNSLDTDQVGLIQTHIPQFCLRFGLGRKGGTKLNVLTNEKP